MWPVTTSLPPVLSLDPSCLPAGLPGTLALLLSVLQNAVFTCENVSQIMFLPWSTLQPPSAPQSSLSLCVVTTAHWPWARGPASVSSDFVPHHPPAYHLVTLAYFTSPLNPIQAPPPITNTCCPFTLLYYIQAFYLNLMVYFVHGGNRSLNKYGINPLNQNEWHTCCFPRPWFLARKQDKIFTVQEFLTFSASMMTYNCLERFYSLLQGDSTVSESQVASYLCFAWHGS